MRTREQNEALEKERLSAQRRLDEARRIADDQQRRAPARSASLAAAALSSTEVASSSGHRQQRSQSAGPASRAPVQRTFVAVSSSQADLSREQAFRHLEQQSNAIAQMAASVLNRSEQLGQTFDLPEDTERGASMQQRPQTAPTVASDPFAEESEHQRPLMPQSSAAGVANGADSLCSEVADLNHERLLLETAGNGPCSTHSGARSPAEQCRDEAVATGVYSDSRYAAYSQELNYDMQLRFTSGCEVEDVEGGYESDLERDVVQQQKAAAEHAASMLLQSFEQEAAQAADADAFRNDNAWMDEYRKVSMFPGRMELLSDRETRQRFHKVIECTSAHLLPVLQPPPCQAGRVGVRHSRCAPSVKSSGALRFKQTQCADFGSRITGAAVRGCQRRATLRRLWRLGFSHQTQSLGTYRMLYARPSSHFCSSG
jgi:hypothetical protein